MARQPVGLDSQEGGQTEIPDSTSCADQKRQG